MLTQLATIKSRLGLDPFDTADDPLLTSLLKHVSARFAGECNRIFDYGAGLIYGFRADKLNILVDHPPIELVSLFHLKTTESEGWVLQSAIDYLISPQKSVIELVQPLGSSRQLGRARALQPEQRRHNGATVRIIGFVGPGPSGVKPLRKMDQLK